MALPLRTSAARASLNESFGPLSPDAVSVTHHGELQSKSRYVHNALRVRY